MKRMRYITKNLESFGEFSSEYRAEGRQERRTTVGTKLHGPTFDKSCAGGTELVSLSVYISRQVSADGSACSGKAVSEALRPQRKVVKILWMNQPAH